MKRRFADANIMLGRLQKGLGGDAVIRKTRLFRELKITLDKLLSSPSDLAPSTRAFKDTAAGIALLLWRAGLAVPSIAI